MFNGCEAPGIELAVTPIPYIVSRDGAEGVTKNGLTCAVFDGKLEKFVESLNILVMKLL